MKEAEISRTKKPYDFQGNVKKYRPSIRDPSCLPMPETTALVRI